MEKLSLPQALLMSESKPVMFSRPFSITFKILLVSSLLLFCFSGKAFALEISDEILEGRIESIAEERTVLPAGEKEKQYFQKLNFKVSKGSLSGQVVSIDTSLFNSVNNIRYQIGDNLVVLYSRTDEGKETFFISDYIRRQPLLWLFIFFVVIAVAVGRRQGFTSLIGMVISFLVIFKFLLPQISQGSNPILISILSALIIVPITFFLSHGPSRKTVVAIIGTMISLVITGILAGIVISAAKMTGFATEEAGFLQSFYPGEIDIRGLLLASIIIGGLGVLDDITISQSAIVSELHVAMPKASMKQLYLKAMNVGHDHIASLINTLVLVYTSSFLPFLVLFIKSPRPFTETINYEFVAEEIIRILVASIGLILAVPITTLLAALAYKKLKLDE